MVEKERERLKEREVALVTYVLSSHDVCNVNSFTSPELQKYLLVEEDTRKKQQH